MNASVKMSRRQYIIYECERGSSRGKKMLLQSLNLCGKCSSLKKTNVEKDTQICVACCHKRNESGPISH